jgi:hypothetical protein
VSCDDGGVGVRTAARVLSICDDGGGVMDNVVARGTRHGRAMQLWRGLWAPQTQSAMWSEYWALHDASLPEHVLAVDPW